MNPSNEALASSSSGGLSLARRVAKNTAWLLLSRLGSQGMALLFGILLARRLGEVGLGQYAFMSSVIFFGNFITTFGTDMLIMREMAAKRELSLLPSALLLQLGLSLPFVVLVFLLAPQIPNQSEEAWLALQVYSLALVPMAFYSVFSAALRGVERMGAFASLNLLNGIMLIGLTWFFLHPGVSIVSVAVLLIVVQVGSALAAAVLCAMQIPGFLNAWKTSLPAVGALWRAAAPIAVLGILSALYQRSSIYLISTVQGAAATGLFSAAFRLVEATKLGQIAFLGALFPVMSQAHTDLDPNHKKLFSASLKLLILLAFGLAVAIYALAVPIITLLYGKGFMESTPILKLLAWLLVPVTLTNYYSLLLLSVEKEKKIAFAFAVSTVVLIPFIVIGLPRMGLAAAAWGMLLSESIQAGLLYVDWRRHDRLA
jgi:O-antigen/teichoic acid export membrane protein